MEAGIYSEYLTKCQVELVRCLGANSGSYGVKWDHIFNPNESQSLLRIQFTKT